MPILITLGWLAAWILLLKLPTLGGSKTPAVAQVPPGIAGSDPSIGLADLSVVIPARNEQDRLPLLLSSLQAQSVTPVQVIVVDDDSDDSTAAFARAFDGVDVISAEPLPQGWTGKSWACATGAALAVGRSVVFLDADVKLAPESLAVIATELHRHGGLISVQPRHEIDSSIEAASMPFNIVGVMALGIGSAIPPRKQWGATGPCMATSKRDYDAVGGHGATAGAVAEDLELASLYNQAGLPVNCVGGGDLISFRMYRNFGEIIIGWSKNMASGARRSPLMRTVGVALWVTAMLQVTGLLLRLPWTGTSGLLVAGLAYTAFTLQWIVLGREVGRFGPWALLWPLINLFFVAIVSFSAFQMVFLRRVKWSGRRVRVGRRTRVGPHVRVGDR